MDAKAQQPSADFVSLNGQLDEADRLLKTLIARTYRENLITIILGALALTVLGAYFAYGYSEIASAIEPKTLVATGESWIEDQLPELRKSLEAEIDRSAPQWAESLSQRAQSTLPSLREKLEDYVLQQVDQTVEQAVTLTEAHFRQLLREKREVLEEGFKDLATNPELASESLARLEEAIEGVFESDLKQGATEVFATLNLMSAKLARLKAGQQLNSEEARERAVLMQFRRLQSKPAVAEPIVEEPVASETGS